MPSTDGKRARSRTRHARRQVADQIRQCYTEYTPPQVKRVRQQNWMDRTNPEPQDVAWDFPTYACPAEGCGKVYAKAKFLRTHMRKKHFPHKVGVNA